MATLASYPAGGRSVLLMDDTTSFVDADAVIELRRPLSRHRAEVTLPADALREMTLYEILRALGLPVHMEHGDADHEDTTAAMDAAALACRLRSNRDMEAQHEAAA